MPAKLRPVCQRTGPLAPALQSHRSKPGLIQAHRSPTCCHQHHHPHLAEHPLPPQASPPASWHRKIHADAFGGRNIVAATDRLPARPPRPARPAAGLSSTTKSVPLPLPAPPAGGFSPPCHLTRQSPPSLACRRPSLLGPPSALTPMQPASLLAGRCWAISCQMERQKQAGRQGAAATLARRARRWQAGTSCGPLPRCRRPDGRGGASSPSGQGEAGVS